MKRGDSIDGAPNCLTAKGSYVKLTDNFIAIHGDAGASTFCLVVRENQSE